LLSRNRKGFTLIEVVLAVVLLASMSVGIYAAIISATKWTQPEVNKGYNVAREKLEALYTSVRQSNWSNAANPLNTTNAPVTETTSLDSTNYARVTTLGAAINRNSGTGPGQDSEEDYRKVEITVTLP
jgi:prepilin-type N-terminal cleavage/methylation domain-containing protein